MSERIVELSPGEEVTVRLAGRQQEVVLVALGPEETGTVAQLCFVVPDGAWLQKPDGTGIQLEGDTTFNLTDAPPQLGVLEGGTA